MSHAKQDIITNATELPSNNPAMSSKCSRIELVYCWSSITIKSGLIRKKKL